MKNRIALILGALAVAAGCQKTESNTEIVLEISTNIPVPAGMTALSLKIGPQTRPDAFAQTYPLGTGTGQIMLPRRMTLVPTDMDTVLSVQAEGLLGNKTVVSRLVNTKFVKGQSKLLHIELLQKCVGQVCPNNQTCTPSASCANPYVEPADLPTFDPTKEPSIPGLDPDAGVSVDAPVDQSTGDGKKDGLSGRDGLRFDGQPGFDGTPSTAEGGLLVDGPGGSEVPPGQDGSVGTDGSLVKLDTGNAIDAPIMVSDVPPASKTKGVACGLSGECESGLCIDGVCCESKCDGMCMACNVPGKLGTCAMVPLNDPSSGDCPDDGVATCGRNGRCNGAGGCMMVPMGVACSAETCPAGTSEHTRQGLCDGEGHCGKGQTQDCAPFLCNATTKACNPTCALDTDCVAPNRCINGSCGKKGNGLPCSAPADCQSNVCAQGVCCAGPCADLCKSCAVEGSLGTCTSVPAGKPDVQSRCLDQGMATCGTNGLCNGADACQKYGDSLVCGTKCDPGAATFTTLICGAGACNPGSSQSCSPYSCDNNGCKKSCTVLADCAVGFECGAGGLCVRPSEKCMNGVDDDADGQADCADTDCQAGFMCVPAVPTDFTGPFELFEGALADMPKCDVAYPVEVFTGWGSLQCPPATCNACGCGAPTGVTCTNPAVAFNKTTTCPALEPIPLSDDELNKCMGPAAAVFASVATRPGRASGGSCDKLGGDAVLPPSTWNAVRTCGVQNKGGGCDKDSICLPRPQNPYRTQVCVAGGGGATCPTLGYSDKHEYFSSDLVDDKRGCTSTCGCGTPVGVSCPSTLEMFAVPEKSFQTCILAYREGDPLKIGSGCSRVPATVNYSRVNVPTPRYEGGSCTQTGTTTPSGTCMPSTAPSTVVCCTP